MSSKDQFITLAKRLHRELDNARQAFRTYNVTEIKEMLKEIAGASANVKGKSFAADLEEALLHEGLLAFPPLTEVAKDGEEGYTRLIRSGSLLGGILNALRFPGAGSDQDLAHLIGRIKRSGGVVDD